MWIVFEVPTWLKHAKLIRIYSLYYAIKWNFIFFIFFRKAYKTIENASKEDFTGMQIFELFFIGYNIFLHGPIFLINSIIIFKEVSFEMMQMRYDALGIDEHISLGLIHLVMLIIQIVYLINPVNWIEIIYYIVYGYY